MSSEKRASFRPAIQHTLAALRSVRSWPAADKEGNAAPLPALLYCDFRNRFTSRADGNEGCAPIRVTEMAATAAA
jgi:hypothetical protein